MRVSDYIIQFLVSKGVKHLFMLAGGQAMFLNDAVARSRKIQPTFVHHEQAAGMAAEAYGRVTQHIGVAMVTAGPAAVNVLNGVVGAWVDSAPMMVISGQSHLPSVQMMEETGIRQTGLQGIYIKPMAQSVVKYFVTITDPSDIAYHLEKAYYEATTGRKGPVWIDVPLDIQRMEVPEKLLHHFESPQTTLQEPQPEDIILLLESLSKAKRPLLYIGQGVKIANASKLALRLIKQLQIPVVTARLGIDIVPSDTPLFMGRPGLYGDRFANSAVQLADLVLSIGARLDPGAIGWEPTEWAKNATKYIVDIDKKELRKFASIPKTVSVHSDAAVFITSLMETLGEKKLPKRTAWIKHLNWIKDMYPTVLPTYAKEKPVNSYYFTERLSALTDNKATIVVDTSSPFHVVCQSWYLKKGQTFLTTGGISTMGYWVAGIGAAKANPKGNTIVVTGDGCLQMNIQEFATVAHNKLPLKIFVINNNGYLLIRHTQKKHMESRFIGESPATGVWCPKSTDIAKAYGIKCVDITSPLGIDQKIQAVLDYDGPVVCDVLSPEWQAIVPFVSSKKLPDGRMISKPFDDLFPFLSEQEMEKIRQVPHEK